MNSLGIELRRLFVWAYWPSWAIAVLLCVLVRGVWMLFVHPEPIADYAFYYTRAIELSQTAVYQYQGHPTAFFPVGTPLILAGPFAALGASLAVAKALSLTAWAMTVMLTFRVGVSVSDNRVGVIAALIVALYPDFVANSALVASENFCLPPLLGCVYCLCKGVRSNRPVATIAVAGLLLGLTIIVRSTAVILLPPLAILIALHSRCERRVGLVAALVFVVSTSLVVAPWIVRNVAELGAPVLTTNGGISLWWGNNPNASGGFPLSVEPPTQNVSTIEDEVSNNAQFTAAALRFMREQPRDWIALIPAKFAFLFGEPSPWVGFALWHRYVGGPWAIEFHPRLGDPRYAHEADYVKRALSPIESKLIGAYYRIAGGFLGQLLQGGLWALGAAGFLLLWIRDERSRGAIAVIIAVPATWVLFHITLGNGQPRYLLSVAPLLALGAAYLITSVASLISARWNRMAGPS